MNARKKNKTSGFTIVELVISMVVIGILATIMFISYGGIIKKVAIENLKSDLLSATSKLVKFKATYGVYPVTISCSVPDSKTNLCIKGTTSDTIFAYNVNATASPDTFGLTASKGNDVDLSYRTANGSEPIACPAGYIVVPGSKTYGTNSFCVMKYEARQISLSGIPISTIDDDFWSNISQNQAIKASEKACTGCHLISEAEWMTLAQNILSVASNWSGGIVGTGYVYSGHNDSSPNNPIDADTNDSNGYANTENSEGNQRRTLALSNGEVVWDMAGNLCEMTSGQVSGLNNQPGVLGGDYEFREWPIVTHKGNLTVDPFPEGTGLSGAATWDSSNGIGKTVTSTVDASLRSFDRGSWWGAGNFAGILTLEFTDTPDTIDHRIGFRVVR